MSTPSSSVVQKILEVAVAAARDAGAHMRANVGAATVKLKSGPADLLTQIDPECEAIIKDAQALHFRFGHRRHGPARLRAL